MSVPIATGAILEAIAFDFDGVLADSVNVKGQAFEALYEDESPDIRAQIRAWHEAHGGVSRFEKIRHYETLCGREADEAAVMARAGRFSQLVEQKVVESDSVPGAEAFLEEHHRAVPFYIVSATPQEELLRIVEKRGLSHYFRGIYGAPVKKGEHLEDIVAANRYRRERVVMIGDADADYEAALQAGTGFIGRVPPGTASRFPEGVAVLPDLTGLAALLGLG